MGGEIFRTCPDRPWGPPNLLYNGYRVFPGGEEAGTWHWPPTPHLALRLRKEYSYTSTPPMGLRRLFYGKLHLFVCLYYMTTGNQNCFDLILVNNQLHAQLFVRICLFQFSTCFEQPYAHHQESQLYQYGTSKPAYRTVTYRERHTPDIVLIQLTLLMMSKWLLETCRELK